MIFTTHENNIKQIKSLVTHFGGCWVHGDGNMFSDDADGEYHSKNLAEYSNPKSDEKTYRVHFKRGDELPKNKQQLDEMLMRAKNQEILSSRHIKETTKVKTFTVEDDVQPAGEIDYSQFNRSPEKTTKSKK